MEERLTTVLLADDHTIFREGLAELLTSYGGLEVVGETTNDENGQGTTSALFYPRLPIGARGKGRFEKPLAIGPKN